MLRDPHNHELKAIDEQQEVRLARLEAKVDEIIGRLNNGRFNRGEWPIRTLKEEHGSSPVGAEPATDTR
jgi:hypothetical protein